VEYLSGRSLRCPGKVNYTSLPPEHGEHDQGSGGYGYNFIYVGSQIWRVGYEGGGCRESARLSSIRRPQETLLFSDTAMAKRVDGTFCLIEYPFAEPRFFVLNQQEQGAWSPFPSIHFRHRRSSNIVWADGHTDGRKMGRHDGLNRDGTRSSFYQVGWFEPLDNSLFDLE
jgi:prepilin-type processing-associated H-X9-DG protein